MPELWILRITLDPLKLYPHMKLISIASVEFELLQNKKCDVRTDRQTDRLTDGRTDGRTDRQRRSDP